MDLVLVVPIPNLSFNLSIFRPYEADITLSLFCAIKVPKRREAKIKCQNANQREHSTDC